MVRYFWDSYAIIEFIDGNPKFAKYSREQLILTIFNLTEIYWFAVNEYGEEKANQIYDEVKQGAVKISDEIIKEAIKFRKKNRKKKLPYADCIGYIYSLRNNLKFLTGDKEFENLENVEFVKK